MEGQIRRNFCPKLEVAIDDRSPVYAIGLHLQSCPEDRESSTGWTLSKFFLSNRCICRLVSLSTEKLKKGVVELLVNNFGYCYGYILSIFG